MIERHDAFDGVASQVVAAMACQANINAKRRRIRQRQRRNIPLLSFISLVTARSTAFAPPRPISSFRRPHASLQQATSAPSQKDDTIEDDDQDWLGPSPLLLPLRSNGDRSVTHDDDISQVTVDTNLDPESELLINAVQDTATDNDNNNKPNYRKKMTLFWCQSDRCVDVVRERVVGEHNQIVLNGPATGQVAYRWTRQKPSSLPYRSSASSSTDTTTVETSTSVALSSVLLLVKKGDKDLMRIAAETVPKLTQAGVRVLLAPDLSAKLKHYHGVDSSLIGLFEARRDDPNKEFGWKVHHVDDDEEDWVQDMMLYKQEPFPDLVVTIGGDGLLIHTSMLFQGPSPPVLAISGGSLGFLTPFAEHEMVDAVKIALGMRDPSFSNDISDGKQCSVDDGLQVFPPNMSFMKPPHLNDSPPRFAFGLGNFICMSVRMRLDCRVVNQEGIVQARYNVLNEVVIDRGSSPYLAALECFCDDVHLTTVQADGVIFAT